MKKSIRMAVTALAGTMTFGMSVVPALAQDVTLVGPPVVMQVTVENTQEGTEGDAAAAEGSEASAPVTIEKEVESFRIFGQTQDGRMLIRTDGGDEYISKDELQMLLPELDLEGFPVVEETKALGQGMNGEDVRMLQEVLESFGYLEGGLDGSYGGGTAASVAKFQEAKGLETTGNADIYTMMLVKAISDGLEESVEVSSKGFESPEEKFPEIVDNTDADLQVFMEPKWRYRFDEETQTAVIDPSIAIGSFAVEAPAIDKISGKVSLKVRIGKDESTGLFVTAPAIAVETESASRPYMQKVVLNGSDSIRLEGAENSGELKGITMYETSYIKLTPEALDALASGDVKTIQLQGKNKDYDVEVNADAEALAEFAETCKGIAGE